MTTLPAEPAIVFAGVVKAYGAPEPLRIAGLRLDLRDRVALAGLDRARAETFVHLITGAAVPDEGSVRIDGRDTRDIATDTDWLASLDRFGIVTDRAVLIEKLAVAANLAVPITLAIDPMSAETRARVEALADLVELPRARLDEPAASLAPHERAAVHLARALAPEPQMLLLEHPTAAIDGAAQRAAFGAALRRAADARAVGWIALADDLTFARAAGGRVLHLDAKTGAVRSEGAWAQLRAVFTRS